MDSDIYTEEFSESEGELRRKANAQYVSKHQSVWASKGFLLFSISKTGLQTLVEKPSQHGM